MNVLFSSAWISFFHTQGFTGPSSPLLLKFIMLTRQPLCPFKNACLHAELQLLVRKGTDFPGGAVTLSSKQTKLNIQLETAAGDPSSYPGNSHFAVFFHYYISNILNELYAHLILNEFTVVTPQGFTTLSLLSYTNLEESANGFFRGMKPKPEQNFQINSKITTITVSNNDTSQLSEPVTLTFYHLKQVKSCLL